ncbi:MAG: SGNH/GDSL hydrolase family protein [Candidatus Microsaccharimonas sp.]
MARLPNPGGDPGQWGDLLNSFLTVSHTNSGELKDGSVSETTLDAPTQAKLNTVVTGVPDDSVSTVKLQDGAVTNPKLADGSVTDVKISGTIAQSKVNNLTSDLAAKAPLNSPAFTGTPTGITKAHVGLANTDNTADSQKPISQATQAGLDAKASTVALNAKADDNTVVHLAGTQTITGQKNFTGGVSLNGQAAVATNDARLTNERIPTNGSVTVDKLADGSVSAEKLDAGNASAGQTLSYNGNSLTWSTPSSSGPIDDASPTTKGLVQLTGDLDGSAASPSVVKVRGVSINSTPPTAGQILKANSATTASWQSAGGTTVASTDITDSTSVGRSLITTASNVTARQTLGLDNVNNTSDANKPVSTAVQNALNTKVNSNALSLVATSGSYDDLDDKPTIPTVTGTNTGDQTLAVNGNQLTISGTHGNTVVLPSGSGSASWGNISGTLSTQTDLQTILDAKATKISLGAYQIPARSTNGTGEWTGGVNYSSSANASTLALRSSTGTLAVANGANTTDAVNKGQLDTKIDLTQKGAASGVAALGTGGLVPATQLGTGTADATTYLRGDGTWQIVQGGSGSTGGPQGTPGAMTVRPDTANPGMFVISNPLDSSAVSLLHGPKQLVDTFGKSAVIMFVGDSTSAVSNGSARQFANTIAAANPQYTVRFRTTSSGNYPTVSTWTIGTPTVIQTGANSTSSLNGERFVTLSGSGGITMTAASIVRTSPDLDVRIKVAASGWVGALNDRQTFIAQRGGAGNYAFAFYAVNNELRLDHSVDGTAELTGSVTLPALTNGSTYWLRATLDVDNDAGGFTKKFFQSTDGITWTQIGSNQTVSSGTTSIFSSTYTWEAGSRGTGTSGTLDAGSKIYEIDIRDGIDGLSIAPTLPDQWEPTSAGVAPVTGAPIIDIWNCSVGGITMRKQYEFRAMLRPRINSLVTFVALGHNDNYQISPDYWKVWNTFLDDIQDRNPMTSIVLIAQNPELTGTDTTPDKILGHAHRTRVYEALAARRGFGFIDIYQLFQDQFAAGVATSTLMYSDGIHPVTAGYTLWGQAITDVWEAA